LGIVKEEDWYLGGVKGFNLHKIPARMHTYGAEIDDRKTIV